MHRFRTALATALATSALMLGLVACGGAEAENDAPASDTASQATMAENYLDLASESGPAFAVSSWSIAGEGWKTEVTNAYDDAGNLTSQETVSSQPNTQTSQTASYTYAENLLTQREATMRIGDVASVVSLTYGTPSFESEGEEIELSYTGNGEDAASGLSYEWKTTYDLEQNGLSLAEWIEQSTVSVPVLNEDGSRSDAEPTEIATNQSVTFDADGRASHVENTITGATLELELAYREDTLDVSGDVRETWSIQTNEQGLITQAERGDGVVISIAYAELASPTNFNRALARCSGGQALVNALTLSLATGLLD